MTSNLGNIAFFLGVIISFWYYFKNMPVCFLDDSGYVNWICGVDTIKRGGFGWKPPKERREKAQRPSWLFCCRLIMPVIFSRHTCFIDLHYSIECAIINKYQISN
jgi:hypothetical protein